MAWPAQAVPGVGFQAVPQPIQVQAPQQMGGVQYSVDHLPPPPGQPQQGYVQQVGVPGTPQAQPYYAQPQQQPQAPLPPQWQQPPQQMLQPQFQQPVQPGFVPQAQLPAQAVMSDGTVLQGEAVPPELRGRTFGEVKRLYSALASDWLQRNRAPTTPAAASLQAQGLGLPPQQPTQQSPLGQGAAGGAQPQGQSNWAQPIAQAVQQALQPMLQPIVQQTQAQAILQAREVARQGTTDFSYLEADVMQMVASLPPEALQNPQTWVMAANAVRGARVAAGQYQPRTAPQIPNSAQRQVGPGVSVPATPMHGYFVEGPTAPQLSMGGTAPRQPTAEDQFYAQRWGMTLDQWMSWKYGVQQPLQGGVSL